MEKPVDDRRMAELAVFVHGILVTLHSLGIVYNLRKRNYWDVAAHTAAAGYDAHALAKHIREIEALDQV